MQTSNRGKGDARADATEVGQGISIDFGLITQKSKNKERMKALTSLDGSFAYMMATYHHSDAIWT
eukprot:2817071-Ditylum_brightwellii.AAC.1